MAAPSADSPFRTSIGWETGARLEAGDAHERLPFLTVRADRIAMEIASDDMG